MKTENQTDPVDLGRCSQFWIGSKFELDRSGSKFRDPKVFGSVPGLSQKTENRPMNRHIYTNPTRFQLSILSSLHFQPTSPGSTSQI